MGEEIGDLVREFTTSLATLLRREGARADAANLLEQALAIYQELGDRDGEAWTLTELGILRLLVDDYPQTATLLEQARRIYQELGDQGGEAWTLAHMGVLRRITGHLRQAADLLERAVTLFRELGDQRAEAWALAQTGALYRITGGFRQAATLLEEARALAGAGRCALTMGCADGSIQLRRASQIFQRLGAAEVVDLPCADRRYDPQQAG